MTNASQTTAPHGAHAADLNEVRAKWGWFVALGALLVVLGALALSNLVLATIVTVYYVGASMIVAGVLQFIHSFAVKTWSGFAVWLLSGAFYAAAGVMTFINPLLASFVLTLMLAILTIASGLLRLWLGYQARAEHGWGWVIASGVVTIIAGLIFLFGWPTNSLWLLGLILSIDLIFQGCALIGLGLRLRSAG